MVNNSQKRVRHLIRPTRENCQTRAQLLQSKFVLIEAVFRYAVYKNPQARAQQLQGWNGLLFSKAVLTLRWLHELPVLGLKKVAKHRLITRFPEAVIVYLTEWGL